MAKKYFVFSSTQLKQKREVAKKLGKKLELGTVLVLGNYKQFTDVINSPNHSIYSDAIVITSGDNLKYNKEKMI